MNYQMKYWRKSYFLNFFEMDETEYRKLKKAGRIHVQLQDGEEVIDIEMMYIPSKYSDKLQKLTSLGY